MAARNQPSGKLDPAKMRQWEQDAMKPPASRAKPPVQEKPAVEVNGHGELRGQALGKEGAGPEEGTPGRERNQNLPADIQSQFPDADLSAVTVVLNSKDAAKQGVDGFFLNGAIHVAPNADVQSVLRHEAAHAAQQVKGKKEQAANPGGGDNAGAPAPEANTAPNTDATAPDTNPAPVADLESQARQAEGGKPMTQDQLGQGDPTRQYNAEARNLNESGAPKMEWSGAKLDKVSGSFEKELAKSSWAPRELFEKETWWRIPAFPAAGVYVKLGANIAPEASLKAKANYAWDGSKYEVSGSLEGELKVALTGFIEGGVGLNVVVQRGGVGIRGSLALEIGAKLSRSISFSVGGPEGPTFRMTPLEFEIGAALKAALTARAWTEGWFWDSATEWTFAEYAIGTLTGAKAQVVLDANRNGVTGRLGTVRPGTFAWGGSPPCTDQNGKEL